MPPETIEVASWLHGWWALWSYVARMAWWPAWSAIFSALALAVTIYLATSNSRRERRKDAAFIEGVAIMCDIVLIGGKSALNIGGEMKGDFPARLKSVGKQLSKAKVFEQIHDIDLSKFPSSASLRLFMNMRAITAMFNDAMVEGFSISEENLRGKVEEGERTVQEPVKEARRIGGRSVNTDTAQHLTKGDYPDHPIVKKD